MLVSLLAFPLKVPTRHTRALACPAASSMAAEAQPINVANAIARAGAHLAAQPPSAMSSPSFVWPGRQRPPVARANDSPIELRAPDCAAAALHMPRRPRATDR